MFKVLDKTKEFAIIKIDIKTLSQLEEYRVFNEDDPSTYEFVFDKSVPAKDLLYAFNK